MDNLKISTMTGKLSGIRALNSNTLSNPWCIKEHAKSDKVCSVCYSVAMLKGMRKNCVPAWQRNSDLLSKPLKDIPVIKDDIFRFSGHGELINAAHMHNIIRICDANPDCQFTLWSKRVGLVRAGIAKHGKPDNLILIYSYPKIDGSVMESPPRGFDRVFNAVPKHMHKTRQNCTGQRCRDCMECYRQDGEVCIVEGIK